MATAPLLEDRLREAGEAHPAEVLLDLAALGFIDCCGVNVVLRAERHARECDYPLTLRPGPPNVQRVLELLGVTSLLRFECAPRCRRDRTLGIRHRRELSGRAAVQDPAPAGRRDLPSLL